MSTAYAPNAPLGATPNPMLPELFRVRRLISETADTATFVLDPADGGEGEAFRPGQFNMIYVFGMGESAISISGDSADPSTLTHTVRAVGSVTKPMLRLRRGDLVGIRGPFGNSWPVDDAVGRDLIIVAGGIGLAPLRPVIYHVLRHRDRFARVSLLYGARTPGDLLYKRELPAWRGRFDLDVRVTVDAAGSDWRGRVGVVTTLMQGMNVDPDDAVAMICGPEIMMRFAALELSRLGVGEDRMFISMERNMQCGLGLCGHCQFGPSFICRDGPVFRYDALAPLLAVREV